MSLFFSLFKYKKIFIVIFLLFSFITISNSTLKRTISENKCDYGETYIKGICIKPNFNIIPMATIDEDGVYKYIQIKCNTDYIFIRGRKDCKYHKNIYKKFLNEVEKNHLDKNLCKCLGGGRIKKSSKDKYIKIYGYSKTFGRIENQHEKTKQILEKFYPDYEISWSNEGY